MRVSEMFEQTSGPMASVDRAWLFGFHKWLEAKGKKVEKIKKERVIDDYHACARPANEEEAERQERRKLEAQAEKGGEEEELGWS